MRRQTEIGRRRLALCAQVLIGIAGIAAWIALDTSTPDPMGNVCTEYGPADLGVFREQLFALWIPVSLFSFVVLCLYVRRGVSSPVLPWGVPALAAAIYASSVWLVAVGGPLLPWALLFFIVGWPLMLFPFGFALWGAIDERSGKVGACVALCTFPPAFLLAAVPLAWEPPVFSC